MMEIRFPNISAGGDAASQVVQMRSFLYQLVQDLNLSLQALEGSGGAAVQATSSRRRTPCARRWTGGGRS